MLLLSSSSSSFAPVVTSGVRRQASMATVWTQNSYYCARETGAVQDHVQKNPRRRQIICDRFSYLHLRFSYILFIVSKVYAALATLQPRCATVHVFHGTVVVLGPGGRWARCLVDPKNRDLAFMKDVIVYDLRHRMTQEHSACKKQKQIHTMEHHLSARYLSACKVILEELHRHLLDDSWKKENNAKKWWD